MPCHRLSFIVLEIVILFLDQYYIAKPQAQNEDDGLIFVNVIDMDKILSYIVYLNAKDLRLVYKAYLSILIPPTLHGIYIK
ncbi:MAG: carotenoid oxygenase family protein [Francisella endosymbiont of Hyalomma asiaticum]